jgi:hypothetical protein
VEAARAGGGHVSRPGVTCEQAGGPAPELGGGTGDLYGLAKHTSGTGDLHGEVGSDGGIV